MPSKTGIWSAEEAAGRHIFDSALADAVVLLFELIESPGDIRRFPVVDLGCGTGDYCAAFKRAGFRNVTGYEGTPGLATQVDLTDPRAFDENQSGYFTLCLEVGEHIPSDYARQVMDNIALMSARHLVLSWAVPGQGGYHHVNELPNETIIDEMRERDFAWHPMRSHFLRVRAQQPYFAKTVMVFERIEL